jgi:hypothetical protein
MPSTEKPEDANVNADIDRLERLRQLIEVARKQAARGEDIDYADARELLADVRAHRRSASVDES